MDKAGRQWTIVVAGRTGPSHAREAVSSMSYDVVVIGAGANGLFAGAYMAKAGQKVLVLESRAWFGGGVSTAEVVAPGFRHDLHSATHIVIQGNPVIRNDELQLISKFGLKYIYPDGVFSTFRRSDLDRNVCRSRPDLPVDREDFVA